MVFGWNYNGGAQQRLNDDLRRLETSIQIGIGSFGAKLGNLNGFGTFGGKSLYPDSLAGKADGGSLFKSGKRKKTGDSSETRGKQTGQRDTVNAEQEVTDIQDHTEEQRANDSFTDRASQSGNALYAGNTQKNSIWIGDVTGMQSSGRGQSGMLLRGNMTSQSGTINSLNTTCVPNLQQAVLWSEILGEPVSKKRRKKRMRQQYGN